MIKLDKQKNMLTISFQHKMASPAEVLHYYQVALISVVKRAILYSRGCDMHEEDVEAIVDVLDLLNHTLPDEKQLHNLELSRPELMLEIQQSLSELEKERIKDLKEIKRLEKELGRDVGKQPPNNEAKCD